VAKGAGIVSIPPNRESAESNTLYRHRDATADCVGTVHEYGIGLLSTPGWKTPAIRAGKAWMPRRTVIGAGATRAWPTGACPAGGCQRFGPV